jgi:hypothetical protein
MIPKEHPVSPSHLDVSGATRGSGSQSINGVRPLEQSEIVNGPEAFDSATPGKVL